VFDPKRNRYAVHRSPYRSFRTLLAVLAVVAVSACGSREVPLTALTPEDLWSQGVERFNERRWEDAIRFFDRFILVGGADPRVHQARFYAAEAHFNRREYVTAASRFSALAADLGRADLAQEARFMACRSYEELAPAPQLDQEYTRAAIDHCQALIEIFPDGEHAADATRIVDEMWHRLAAKTFQGGEWYYRRRALDSALIYFEDVVRLYPRTSYAPRALRRMIDIYQTLDYPEELADTRNRLLRSYPDSPEARALAADG
jgi:outer membrane protein assembly factor BamD